MATNMGTTKERFNRDTATKQFREAHHDKVPELDRYFSSVQCFRLPSTTCLWKESGKTVDGEIVYKEQIEAIQACLSEYALFPERLRLEYMSWLSLLQIVLERISNKDSVSIYSLLVELADKGAPDLADIAFRLFRTIRFNSVIFTLQDFQKKRDVAAEYLAHMVKAISITQKQLPDVSLNVGEKQLEALIKYCSDFEPCVSLYPGKGTAPSYKQSIYCYQSKASHGTEHRTCVDVTGAGNTLKKRISDVFGLQYRDTWSGNHVSQLASFDKPSWLKKLSLSLKEKGGETVLQSFKKFLKTNAIDQKQVCCGDGTICTCCGKETKAISSNNLSRSVFLSYSRLLVGLRFSIGVCEVCYPLLKKEIQKRDEPKIDDCIICLDENRTCVFVPCGHFGFCKSCSSKVLLEAEQKQVKATCPFCRQIVEKYVTMIPC